jgi:hypothetical protein
MGFLQKGRKEMSEKSKKAKLLSVQDVAKVIERHPVWVYQKALLLKEPGDITKGRLVRIVEDTAKRRGPKHVIRFTQAGLKMMEELSKGSSRKTRRLLAAFLADSTAEASEVPAESVSA